VEGRRLLDVKAIPAADSAQSWTWLLERRDPFRRTEMQAPLSVVTAAFGLDQSPGTLVAAFH